MEITLKINGEDKTFVQEFIPLKLYRKAVEIEKYAEENPEEAIEVFDKQLNLIVEAFGKQFTKDELENGMNVQNHREEIYNIIGVGILGLPTLEEQKEEVGKFLEKMKEGEDTQQKNDTTN